MASLAFDTRRVSQRLLDAGFIDRQAATLTDVLVEVSDATRREVATKADVDAVKSALAMAEGRLKADLELSEARVKAGLQELKLESNAKFPKLDAGFKLVQWMLGFVLALLVTLLGISIRFLPPVGLG